MSDNSNANAQLATAENSDDGEIKWLDLLQVVVDNLRLLVLAPLACGLVALAISFAIPPTYTAKAQFLPPQQQQSSASSLLASLGALGALGGATTGIKNPSDQYIAFMKSVSLQDTLIEKFALMERYETELKTDARTTLTRMVRIASGKDGLIVVEVDDNDPKFAADLANGYLEELGRLLGRLAVTEAQQRRMFFEKQLKLTKDNFAKADLALKQSGVNSTALKLSPGSAVEAVARLKAGISVQEVKLGSMRNYLTENSPEFKQAMNELSSLKMQLFKAEKDEPLNSDSSDYVAKYREFKYQETMFELFARQFELAKLDESREGAVIQVLDLAEPPERKAKPKKAQIAVIATLATGIALLLIVFIRQYIESASQQKENQERFNELRASWKKALGF